ncbi:hypothetical protein DRQ25_13725 [Candidatus Fermentibacteria bacterium]|nr:MAG: hypothetical protein DRQ25_13725 [Candidatus Fermentibacteria bacterium]
MNHFTFGLVLAVFIAAIAVPLATAEEGSYTFAVLCDTRSDMDGTGVNVSAVRAICHDLRARGAEFVLAPGDLFCGDVPDSFFLPHTPPIDSMYQSFIDAIEAEGVGLPGSDAEIALYPTRGNHEGYYFTMTKEEVEEAWLRYMGHAVPANGPEHEVGFTYSFLHEGDLFMGLEMYLYSDSMMMSGIRVNQEWIDRTLSENPDADRVFVFGHTPLFSAYQRDCLEENPVARDAFVRSIQDRCGVYLCGHDHFYARARVPVYAEDGSTITGWIQQVLTPSGAPFMTGARSDISKWNGLYEDENVIPETYIDNAMGYQLITVEDDRVTVEFIGTQDGTMWTRDAQGVYHYTYNTDWERWNFAVLDLFILERE